MKEILNSLFDHKTLSQSEAKEVLMNIGKGQYNMSSVAAFMSVYLMRAIAVEEMIGFREALLELCFPVTLDNKETIDIVGTGGDGKNTFNISTLACFVAAGAGIAVTKHGNYGVSSVSGSSNVLEKIGVKFTNDSALLNKQLNQAGICFMHAPLFHPAMKSVAPVRKELGVRTFFNLLGPLVNPSRPKYILLGTYSMDIMRLYHYLLQETNHVYFIVHSYDGYDEISLTGKFKLISTNEESVLEPSYLGMTTVKEKDLYGGNNIEDAADLFLKILNNEGTKEQKNVVVANAAMAIHCVKNNQPLSDCIDIAKESLESKNALSVYKKLINIK
ncbi:MAG TPA: anthranilate phosphoribosyltransferase [Bacteroidia bacterium]|nr:anthranilate phosphoribosyltransferase [Bacteroidia bacterium]